MGGGGAWPPTITCSSVLVANEQSLSWFDDLLFISKRINENKIFNQSIKIFNFYSTFTTATKLIPNPLSLNSRRDTVTQTQAQNIV